MIFTLAWSWERPILIRFHNEWDANDRNRHLITFFDPYRVNSLYSLHNYHEPVKIRSASKYFLRKKKNEIEKESFMRHGLFVNFSCNIFPCLLSAEFVTLPLEKKKEKKKGNVIFRLLLIVHYCKNRRNRIARSVTIIVIDKFTCVRRLWERMSVGSLR